MVGQRRAAKCLSVRWVASCVARRRRGIAIIGAAIKGIIELLLCDGPHMGVGAWTRAIQQQVFEKCLAS